MDAQAGLGRCCSQTLEDRFSRVEAQLFSILIGATLKRRNMLPFIVAPFRHYFLDDETLYCSKVAFIDTDTKILRMFFHVFPTV